MERTEENNATKDRFAHVGKTFSEIKRKIDALMELHMSGI